MYTEKLLCSNFPYVCYVGILFYMWDEWISFQANCSSVELEAGKPLNLLPQRHVSNRTETDQVRQLMQSRWLPCENLAHMAWLMACTTQSHKDPWKQQTSNTAVLYTPLHDSHGTTNFRGYSNKLYRSQWSFQKLLFIKLNARILRFYKQYLKWKSKDISSVSRYS